MEKTITSLLIVILGLSFTAAFATPFEFQNKELNANLADGKQIHIQFTDDIYPIVDTGYIIGNTGFSLVDTPFRIYQNSFLITMPEQGWFIVGSRTQDNNYAVNLNEWNGAKFLKTEFKASLETIKVEQPSIVTPSEPTEPTATPMVKKDLIVLVKQSFRNYWNDNYQIFVKVFDKAKNPNPEFDDHSGTVDNAQIDVTLVNPTVNKKYTLSGVSKNNGYWQGSQYFAENVSPPGKYLVDVTAKYGESTKKASEEMFLFGVAANRVATGNSTAP